MSFFSRLALYAPDLLMRMRTLLHVVPPPPSDQAKVYQRSLEAVISKNQPLWCHRLYGAVPIPPCISNEYLFHHLLVYPPPQQSRYLLPELVMASRVMLALAPARNRASYSTLINWYLEECKVLDLYFISCRCQTVVNKLPLTLSKIC